MEVMMSKASPRTEDARCKRAVARGLGRDSLVCCCQ